MLVVTSSLVVIVGLMSLTFWGCMALREWDFMQEQASYATIYNQQANEVHDLTPGQRRDFREWSVDSWQQSVSSFVAFCVCCVMVTLNSAGVSYLF